MDPMDSIGRLSNPPHCIVYTSGFISWLDFRWHLMTRLPVTQVDSSVLPVLLRDWTPGFFHWNLVESIGHDWRGGGQKHIGETSRSAYTRDKEHLKALEQREEGSVLWRHCCDVHAGFIVFLLHNRNWTLNSVFLSLDMYYIFCILL